MVCWAAIRHGSLLHVNQGHSRKEDWALNLAGLLAVGIALFPMRWDCYHHSFSTHGFCAISFFVCIAFVSAICSPDTLVLITDPQVRSRYQKTYIGLAIAMILSPIAAYAFNFITSQRSQSIGQSYLVFMHSRDTGVSRPKRCLDPT